jgi:hypothetical protein
MFRRFASPTDCSCNIEQANVLYKCFCRFLDEEKHPRCFVRLIGCRSVSKYATADSNCTAGRTVAFEDGCSVTSSSPSTSCIPLCGFWLSEPANSKTSHSVPVFSSFSRSSPYRYTHHPAILFLVFLSVGSRWFPF